MLTPMTEKEINLTVKNVLSACRDIWKLNKRGYKLLYLASGFIAHYNLRGFQCTYETPWILRADILANWKNNQWLNFSPADRDYAYYRAKAVCYDRVCQALKTMDGAQYCFAD